MNLIRADRMENILLNIIGGFLASIVFFIFYEFIKWLKKCIQKRKFKQVFGKDSVSEFNIVYGKMVMSQCYDANGKLNDWPLEKPGISKKFRISSPISFTCTKSAKYLSESFVRNSKYTPKLISDEDIKEKVDISYCSIGGYNNYKTIDILESEENRFYKFTDDGIVDKDDSNKKYNVDGTYDYGIILKIKPRLFPNRVWIAVAGLGEWGTSGPAWYLARNWRKIRRKVKNREFGIVFKVKGGKDESAEIVDQK